MWMVTMRWRSNDEWVTQTTVEAQNPYQYWLSNLEYPGQYAIIYAYKLSPEEEARERTRQGEDA